MDNLTHSLVGALIGQTGLKKKTGLAMPALVIGANLPDVDAACFFWLEGTEHLGFRRGITHGPPAMVLLPLLLAGLLWGWDRWQTSRGKRPEGRLPVHFGWLYGLALLGCLTHPALDWMNVYGIRLLEPFSSQWFYSDVLFIIDVWLWALMGLGLWWSFRREKRGRAWRLPAGAVLTAVLAYIGVQALETQNARLTYGINAKGNTVEQGGTVESLMIPDEIIIASPMPIWSSERELIIGEHNNYFVIRPGETPAPRNARPIASQRCQWPDVETLRQSNSSLDAFLFWSRTPMALRADDGSVLIRDARFLMEGAGGENFTVPLPDVACEEPDG